ncbi:MAG: hypothetical protein LUE09_03855 [Synergistaceae bacterium]|nr:hypothetical protein [Synergistaceae bacterium]
MSMHEIESLVESSVITLAQHAPEHPRRESICLSLYALQKQFDCGYTLPRVANELIKLNYLFYIPVAKLPQPERGEAEDIMKNDGGFLAGKTYVDRESGLCYVTAGSELWGKLLDLKILTESARSRPSDGLYPMELAEIIVPIAARAAASGEAEAAGCAAKTLGLWYALFPLLCAAAGYDDEANAPEEKQIHELLCRLSLPEAFAAA